jgi:hypothetical protein
MSSHSHSFDGRWPFQDPDNTAAFCCEHVFSQERPILYVTHDHDGDWQFLCGQSHSDGKPRVVCLGCMVERDPTIWTLADMPAGWGADRDRPGANWNREANPAPQEESSSDD